MEKIWLKHYPAGVPADIDANKYQSIRDLFEESAASFGERPAYHCMGKRNHLCRPRSHVAGVRRVAAVAGPAKRAIAWR